MKINVKKKKKKRSQILVKMNTENVEPRTSWQIFDSGKSEIYFLSHSVFLYGGFCVQRLCPPTLNVASVQQVSSWTTTKKKKKMLNGEGILGNCSTDNTQRGNCIHTHKTHKWTANKNKTFTKRKEHKEQILACWGDRLIFAFLLKLQLKIAIVLKVASFGHSHLFIILPRDVKTSDVQKLLLGSPRNSPVLRLHCPELANEHVCTTEQHIKA